jgi:hypothetical protein
MRDRYSRFTIVIDIMTIVTMVGAGLLFWGSLETSFHWQAEALRTTSHTDKLLYWGLSNESHRTAERAVLTIVLVLLANLAFRIMGWVWIGRFWR